MTTTSASAPAQPLLDLHRLLIAIRRKRRFWLSAALLGLIAGAVLAVLMPTPPTAVARLIVLHEDDQPTDGGTLIRTDVAVLQTTRIADAALKALNIDERPEVFLKTYEGVGVTNNVLELTVVGSNNADAVARAKALAEAFIADHGRRMRQAADATAQALLNQRDRIQTELDQVDTSIAQAATAPRADRPSPAQLESLYARRADLAFKVSDFASRANEASIGTPHLAAGTQIIDGPRAVKVSPLMIGITYAGIGFALGLAAGLAFAAVASVVRDRPVLRREISAELGASVIAQLPAPHRGPARLWRRSRNVTERQRVAATLTRAARANSTSVSVLELGCPRTATALAVDIAEALADTGPVVIVDDLPHRRARRLAAQSRREIRILDGGEDAPESTGPRVHHIGLGSVTPGTAWTDLERLGVETVLVVRAGHAGTAWLHTVARQLADCRIPIVGVVLVGPDRRDRTDGTLWDGLHTALRGRAGRVAVAGNGVHNGDLPTKEFTPVSLSPTKDLEV